MLCLIACAPEIPEGHFACQSDDECPGGWSCWSDGFCYSTEEELGADAGARDATAPSDAGALDAQPRDTGPRDALPSDAQPGVDAARPDAANDAGPVADLGTDAGPGVDVGPVTDGGVNLDAGTPGCACTSAPSNFTLGVLEMASSNCPAGFEGGETALFAELDPGPGCTGNCACQAQPTTCLGQLYVYATTNECAADTSLTGGALYNDFVTDQCTNEPVAFGFPGGYRLGNWNVVSSCTPSGTAAPSPYRWNNQAKFCAASLGSAGCGNNESCLDAMQAQASCVITSGGAACPAPYTNRITQWFTGLSDTRSCGACQCNATGASCEFAYIALGSDYVCTDALCVQDGTQAHRYGAALFVDAGQRLKNHRGGIGVEVCALIDGIRQGLEVTESREHRCVREPFGQDLVEDHRRRRPAAFESNGIPTEESAEGILVVLGRRLVHRTFRRNAAEHARDRATVVFDRHVYADQACARA